MTAEEVGIYFGIAASLAAGAWVLYRHFSGEAEESNTHQEILHGDDNVQIGQAGRDVTIIKGAEVDVNGIVGSRGTAGVGG